MVKVVLLAHTPNPESTVAAAAKLCYSASTIEGIQKTGDHSVRVTLTKVDAPAIYNLGIEIAPMHYYGDASLYDYDNNSFGFPKGDRNL